MSSLKQPGNYNCGVMANLFDVNGNLIGTCFDAPVPIAAMLKAHPEIVTIKAYYPSFGTEVTTREDYAKFFDF